MSDEDCEFTVDNIPVTPGTPAARQLAIQQGTILQLRAENARLSTVEDRLQALEDAVATARTQPLADNSTTMPPPSTPRPVTTRISTTSVTTPTQPPQVTRISPTNTQTKQPSGPPTYFTPIQRLVSTSVDKAQSTTMPPPPQPPHVTTDLLLDRAPALQRKKDIKLFPHTFITRSDGCKAINRGEAM